MPEQRILAALLPNKAPVPRGVVGNVSALLDHQPGPAAGSQRWRSGSASKQSSDGGSGMASELNLSNVGGVFVVLIGGMGLALVVAIFEFLGECRNIAKEDEVSNDL